MEHTKGQMLINKDLSAKYVLMTWQKVFLILFLILMAWGFIFHYNCTLWWTVLIFNLAFTYIIIFRMMMIILGAKILLKDSSAKFVKRIPDDKLPTYTVMLPLYKEAEVVPHLIKALSNMDYPTDKMEIMILLEEDDKETQAAVKKLNPPAHFKTIVVPHSQPKTKAKACNYGLEQAKGEIICIYDAEDIPDPMQMRKVVQKFQEYDEKVVAIQCRLNFYNGKENLLTNMFEIEYQTLYNFIMPVASKYSMPIPLGGSSNHIKKTFLDEVKGWDPYNTTEDADLGMKLAALGYQCKILMSYTKEEAVSDLSGWMKQRVRWLKGFFHTSFIYLRHPFALMREFGFKGFGFFSYIMFLSPITALLTPVAIFLTLVVLMDYYTFPFFQDIMLRYYTWLNFLLTILNFLFTPYLVSKLSKHEYLKYKWVLHMFYFVLQTVAAVIAMYKLAREPHKWDKTEHSVSKFRNG